MPTTTTHNITRTEASVDSLKFAHNRLVIIEGIITEEDWAEKMFLYGCRYAFMFASLFGNKQDEVEQLLTKYPPDAGCTDNWFWMWWRFKWMYDDWDYITNKVQRLQGLTYEHYKCYMLNSETLEQDLLTIMGDKIFYYKKTQL